MKIWNMLLLAPIMLLAFAVACDGGSSEDEAQPTATVVVTEAAPPDVTAAPTGTARPQIEVPQEIVDAIDAYIRTVGLNGGTDGRPLVTDCAALGPEFGLCLDLPSSTVSDTQAIIPVFANRTDAFWELTLVKEDGAWTVTGVTYGGP